MWSASGAGKRVRASQDMIGFGQFYFWMVEKVSHCVSVNQSQNEVNKKNKN